MCKFNMFITAVCVLFLKTTSLWHKSTIVGGFRGGAEGAAALLFLLYFQNVLRFCFENRFIKCSLILFSETLTLLDFASRIRQKRCMLHVLKSEVFVHGGGGGGGWRTLPPLLEFSGSTADNHRGTETHRNP